VTYFFNGQAVAVRVDDGSPALSWIHTDHLGSTSVATDGSGNYVTGSRAKYMPFGEERQVSTADLNDRGFTGHIENRDIGLTYMNARFYAPTLNRFVTADTIIPKPGESQGYNRYAYVRNNPIISTDPSGHADTDGCEVQMESCSLPDFLNVNETWIDREGSYYTYDPKFSPERLDAFGAGVSVSISIHASPAVSIEAGGGLEAVVDPDDSNVITVFLVGNWDISLGYEDFWNKLRELFGEWNEYAFFQLNVTPYVAGIHNVDNVVEDYSGPFVNATTTAAYPIGAMWGTASAPGDDPYRPSADVLGFVLGTGFSVNRGTSQYIPLFTVNPWASTLAELFNLHGG
jgi:RHS repeat-associated protein